jgi:hypothetical protein
MKEKIVNGTKKTINGKSCIYYDGYWIRSYEQDRDSLATRKKLIDQLTKRVFHHVESGINTPGFRLEEIREIYENENDPARKRVKGAMLAGALLNRGSDILTSMVELEEAGVKVKQGSELLKECGQCYMEALELGKNIKLANGGEGLDELWGEPFKVFQMPIESFYESRYIKVAQTMSEIDLIADRLILITKGVADFENAESNIKELADSAKLACETLRSDPVSFDVWPRYVAAKERFESYLSSLANDQGSNNGDSHHKMVELIKEGGTLLTELSTVRVPMPKSMEKFFEKCEKLI